MKRGDLRETFDRVVVINLRSQVVRLANFYRRLPFRLALSRKPVPFAAVDAAGGSVAKQWEAAAAWGCFRSHYQVISEALKRWCRFVAVLEDDAICGTTSPKKLKHLSPPCLRTGNGPSPRRAAYRTGAGTCRSRLTIWFTARTTPIEPTHTGSVVVGGWHVFKHLNDPERWGWGRHVDHRLGELHKDFPGGIYVPAKWLVGQHAGWSNIKRKTTANQFLPMPIGC
ncbi:MAG: hypothetical protein R3C05_12515 [Pirellulaceae bacterium]